MLLKDTCNALCNYYVNNFIIDICEEKYDLLLLNEIIDNLKLYNIKCPNKKDIKLYINDYLKDNYALRCDGNTYIEEKKTKSEISKIEKKIEYLKNVVQPQQRTEEWYIFRHNHLTASNLWKVFGSKSSINQIIYDKCLPIDPNKYKPSFVETPMSWGNKYEDVSIMMYEKKYNTKVRDYGCVPHINHEFIAASPDGINDDKSSPLFGRMLEIKNIVNRKITENPKKDYWIQMQLQMEVCDLDECDFLETRFIEYESYDDFIKDGSFTRTEKNEQKGLMIYIKDKVNECPLYEYMPIDYNESEYKEWEKSILKKYNNDNYEWLKNIYWKLDEMSCLLVRRNREWFKEVYPKLETVWNTIVKERQDNSYVKRAPKKREKNINTNTIIDFNKKGVNDVLKVI